MTQILLDTSPENDTRTRLPYLDILRIVAIYLVIMLHCIAPVLINTSIFGTRTWWACDIMSSFVRMGVPLFFMISGYLLLDDSKTLEIKHFYKRRLLKILIPFLTWDVIYFVCGRLTAGQSMDISAFFSELIFQGSKYHLWFVYSLLGIYLLTPFLKRIIDACTDRQLLWFLIVILLPVTIFRFINTVTPLNIYIFGPLMEGYVGFFIFGYILGKYPQSKKLRLLIYSGGVAGVLIGVFGNYYASTSDSINVVFNAGYSITHYLTAGALFVFIKYLSQSHKFKSGRLRKGLSGFAMITYGIYLSHALVLEGFNMLKADLSPALYIIVSFFVTSLVSTAVMLAVSKMKKIRKLFM